MAILAAAVALLLAAHLISSAVTYRVGFPLDDAWIHQTYARNLARLGEWSFIPGIPSAGSTSPLWTALLAPGFFLPFSPYLWTYFLGGALLLGIALLVESFLRRTVAAYHPELPWAGLLFVFEWHLAWAAFSGMETILHILLVFLVVNFILSGSRRYLAAGIVTGLSVWVRPDGLTLLGPLVLAILLEKSSLSVRLRGLLSLVVGFGIFFLPYLFFNLVISGTPMPNTFYAKQAEYVSWQALSLGERGGLLALQFFLGVSLILIPGFVLKVFRALRQRDWGVLLVAVWLLGYLLLYLLRLPVYQHGRYYLPALAVFILLGLAGFLENLTFSRRAHLTLSSAVLLLILIMVLLSSSLYGVYTYGQEVAYIESQMVDTAIWVAGNLPPAALVAAHDIGALGFYDHHQLLDLAGLISPAVVPFMNDNQRLAAYLTSEKVQYLIAFPGWRPELSGQGLPVHEVGGPERSVFGLGNLTVYRWPNP
jgi:hypothetical protein